MARLSQRMRSPWSLAVVSGGGALILYLGTIAPSIAELHGNWDSAELVTVASVLGVAHPPGSAIWLPLGWAALQALAFLEEPALRTNVLSALTMAAAVGTVALIAQRWSPSTPGWAGLLAAALTATAPVVWAQAVVTEVLALQLLLSALAILIALDLVDRGRGRAPTARWAAFGIVIGLLVWNHPTGLALAVPLTAVVWSRARPGPASLALLSAGVILPGIYTAGYLAARAEAPIAWGDTGSAAGLWRHLSGAAYRDLVERSPIEVLAALPPALRLAIAQIPWPLWPLLPLGAVRAARERGALAGGMLAGGVILIVFVAAYRATGREDYLATVALLLALAGALGAVEARDRLRAVVFARRWEAAVPALIPAAIVVAIAGRAILGGAAPDHDAAPQIVEARAALAAATAGDVIETQLDEHTFPLWYLAVVRDEGPPLWIRDTRGLAPAVRSAAAGDLSATRE